MCVMDKSNNSGHQHHNRDGSLFRTTDTSSGAASATTSSDFVLQWGNRKRLRCLKLQVKQQEQEQDNANTNDSAGLALSTVQVDRRVSRSDHNKDASTTNHPSTAAVVNGNGYLNLGQRPPSHRLLRNSETSIAMKGLRGLSSQDRVGALDNNKRGAAHNTTVSNHLNSTATNHRNKSNDNNNNHGAQGGSASSETAHDGKKGGSSSGSEAIPAVWPPKFVIALTNKEKEEDFIAFKGTKLPHRPKKRAKFIQRTLNLVSPGAWLCDLTLERYEVRERKVSKKRPTGLKAMGNMESDSD